MPCQITRNSWFIPALLLVSLLGNIAVAEESTVPSPACPVMQDGEICSCKHYSHHGAQGTAGMELFERMATELALSDTQKQELGTLLEMYRPRISELVERSIASSKALFEIAPDDPAYNSRAAELSQLAGTTSAEIVTLMSELQANAYALLMPEQQAKFLQLRAERRQRMETMRDRNKERRSLRN
jgi:Spy/CpxP family protein refolding chaperone